MIEQGWDLGVVVVTVVIALIGIVMILMQEPPRR